MYLAKRTKPAHTAEPTVQAGPVTRTGPGLGVWLRGERRDMTLCAPGGYCWAPALGEEVLVLKEEGGPCAVAVRQDRALAPGEVAIHSTGDLLLEGKVKINGVALEELIRAIVKEEVGE